MGYQALSLVGALLVLGAYLANHRGWLGPRSRVYNLMNLVGASALAVVAVVDGRVGFIVLEGVWALIAIPPLIRPDARPAGDAEDPNTAGLPSTEPASRGPDPAPEATEGSPEEAS